jgi:hypothetical protein
MKKNTQLVTHLSATACNYVVLFLVLALKSLVSAAPTVSAVYFAQTHLQKASDPYPTFVGNANTLVPMPHVEPTWAYDPPNSTFIPFTVQPETVGTQSAGIYKVDPMRGGGAGDQEYGFLFNHFSDYSVHKLRDLYAKEDSCME